MKFLVLSIFIIGGFLIQESSEDVFVDALVKGLAEVQSFISLSVSSNCTFVKTFLGLTYQQMVASGFTPNTMDLKINLHTATEVIKFNFSSADTDIIQHPKFNKALPVTVIIHGFLTTESNSIAESMVTALVKRGGTNVLYLDASKLIFFFYLYASTVVQFIGESFGYILAAMKDGGVNPTNIHLIGHSLGAQISGFAGQEFTILTGSKLGRISGLDPAGPCFYTNPPDAEISPTDADFVDIIHSDQGVFGINKPVGHVDFYPNGGSAQPGAIMIGESHARAWKYYNESIYPALEKKFMAVKCDSWKSFNAGLCKNNEIGYMGYAASKSLRGNFYLRTAATIPYGLGTPGKNPSSSFLLNLLGL